MIDRLVDAVVNAASDTRDLSDICVISQSRRPSIYLYERLAKKGCLFPPAVLSLTGLAQRAIIESRLPYALGQPSDILYCLYEAVSDFGLPIKGWESFLNIGEDLYRCIEMLEAYEVSDEKIKDVPGLFSFADTEGMFLRLWANMAGIRSSFHSRLINKNILTPNLALKVARDCVKSLPFMGYIGFCMFGVSKNEMAFMNALSEKSPVEYIFHSMDVPVLNEALDSLAALLNVQRQCDAPAIKRIEVHPCCGAVRQIKAVAAAIAPDAAEGKKIAVILPDKKYLLPIIDILEDAFDAFNITMGYNLSETPLGSAIDILSELVLGSKEAPQGIMLDIGLLPRFLESPYISGWIPYDVLAEDTARIRKYAEEHALDYAASDEIKGLCRHMSQAMDALYSAVEDARRTDDLRGFVNTIESFLKDAILASINGGGLADVEIEYAFLFFNECERLRMSAPAGLKMGWSEAARVFRMSMSRVQGYFYGDPLKGLQIMGGLESRNLPFDTVVYTFANEGILPLTPGAEFLLVDAARVFLGIPKTEDMQLVYMYNFYSTVALSQKVMVFYEAGDQRSEPTRFIEQMRLLFDSNMPQAKKGIEFIWHTPIPVVLPAQNSQALSAPKPKDISQALKRFSASKLNTYLMCPMQFYFKYIIGIGDKRRDAWAFEADEVGTLAHLCLERVYGKAVGNTLSKTFFEEAIVSLPGLIEQAAEYALPSGKAGNIRTRLLLKVIEKRLSWFLEMEMNSAIGRRVFYVEKGDEEKETFRKSYRVGADEFIAYGRADRIDVMGEESIVIDYKTGQAKTPSAKQLEKLVERADEADVRGIFNTHLHGTVQLPLYAAMFSHTFNKPLAQVNAAIASLREIRYDYMFQTGEQVDRKVLIEGFEAVLVKLIAEILDPERPFVADEKKCFNRCPYRAICRGV